MSVQSIWSQMSGVTIYSYTPGWDVIVLDGQSLALGFNTPVEDRPSINYRDRNGVKFPLGLLRSDSTIELPVPIRINGPMTLSYDLTSSATSMPPAQTPGFTTAAMTFAQGLDAWRKSLGLTLRLLVPTYNGIPGTSIIEFTNNPASGTFGDLIRRNHRFMMASIDTLLPTAAPLFYACLQGEADVGQSVDWYLTNARIAYDAALGDLETQFGARPPVMIWQTGSYTETVGDLNGSVLAQLQLVSEYSATFAGPLYPYLTYDNVVHPDLTNQMMQTELGAMVWAERERGVNINLLPGTPVWAGNTVTIPFTTRSGRALTFDPVDKYAAYGGLVNHGVEATGATITSVTLAGSSVVVTCDGPMTQVQIALQSQDVTAFVDGQGKNYGAHRCDIMESEPAASLLLPGQSLKRFVPSCRFTRP